MNEDKVFSSVSFCFVRTGEYICILGNCGDMSILMANPRFMEKLFTILSGREWVIPEKEGYWSWRLIVVLRIFI